MILVIPRGLICTIVVVWVFFTSCLAGNENASILITSMTETYTTSYDSFNNSESKFYTPTLETSTELLTQSSAPTNVSEFQGTSSFFTSSFTNETQTFRSNESINETLAAKFVPRTSVVESSQTFSQLESNGHPAISSNESYNLTSSVTHSYVTKSDLIHETTSVHEASYVSQLYTPLMSLLIPSSSLPFPVVESTSLFNAIYSRSVAPHTSVNSNNESLTPESSTIPVDHDHKKLLMLVLRAEDCSKLSKQDFERMLGKLMTKFGFRDATPEISNAKCYSHLNINFTLGSSTPTLQFLPSIDGRHNVTVDVLNRTFRVVKLEKIDMRYEKSKSSNASNAITKVTRAESMAYIAVGVSFGLVLIICVSVCCIKCFCPRKPPKRFGTSAKCTHVRLRPDDYTLTPIPRPTSLYVDYYRGSVAADIYSTTSAGSVASTTPTVEGIVHPFDTSIVPLEDSATFSLECSRDPSVESVPAQSDMKTFNIHSFASRGLRHAAADSKEHLNPKLNSRSKYDSRPSGVTNPIFQRY